MTDPTPPLHPKEREQLDTALTLVVTVRTPDEFAEDVPEGVETLERGDDVDDPPSLTVASYDDLLETLTPRVLELIEAVRSAEPESINEAARVVDRDVKNVHEELSRLARLGVIYFEEEANRKRPVVWFDELVISLPLESESSDHGRVAP